MIQECGEASRVPSAKKPRAIRTIALQQKMLGVPEIVRLFALVNVAMADAAIASWDSKYFYQYWRPGYSHSRRIRPQFLPARRSRHQHGGSELHAAVSGLYIRPRNIRRRLVPMLRHFWPNETPFTFVSDEFNGKNKDVNGNIMPFRPASFKSFSDAEWANAQSRIYLGIHWHFDAEKGIEQGNHVADFVFDHAFRPVREESP
jgi:hypothetical protein